MENTKMIMSEKLMHKMKNEVTFSNWHYINAWIDVLEEPEYDSGKERKVKNRENENKKTPKTKDKQKVDNRKISLMSATWFHEQKVNGMLVLIKLRSHKILNHHFCSDLIILHYCYHHYRKYKHIVLYQFLSKKDRTIFKNKRAL